MALNGTTTAYPRLLAAVPPQHGKPQKPQSRVVEPDSRSKSMKVEDPAASAQLLIGVWLFIAHCVISLLMSSMCHIPFHGEAPWWIRLVIFTPGPVVGIAHHILPHKISFCVVGTQDIGSMFGVSRTVVSSICKCCFPVFGMSFVFFFSKLYHDLCLLHFAAMVSATIIVLALPTVMYKMVAEEPMPDAADYDAIIQWGETKLGLLTHAFADTAPIFWFGFCWAALGYPSPVQ